MTVYIVLIKGNKVTCYKIRVKLMKISWTMQEVKLADISETKGGNNWKTKLMSLQQTIEIQIKGACTEASTFLSMITKLELIW